MAAKIAYQVLGENGFSTSAPGFTVPGFLKKNEVLESKGYWKFIIDYTYWKEAQSNKSKFNILNCYQGVN